MVISATELHEKELPPRKLLCAPILGAGEVVMIHSVSGIGKTQFAMSLAVCLAGGSKFLKWQCAPTRVLYADCEMGEANMKQRFHIMASSFPQFTGAQFAFDCFDDVAHKTKTNPPELLPYPKLSDLDARAYWDKHIENYDVMVVDNIGGMISADPLARDDDFRAWARAWQWIQKWKARGKSFILVHHQNKAGTGFAGGQKKENDCDLNLGMYELKSDTVSATRNIELRFEKVRHIAWPDTEPLHISFSIFDGRIIWKYRSLEGWTQERINALKEQNLKPAQIAKQLGVTLQRVQKYVPTSYDDEEPLQQPLYESEDDDGLF